MTPSTPEPVPQWSFHATITLLRASEGIDREGNQIRDWSTATRTTITGLSVQPLSTSETLADNRDQTRSAWRIYSPPGRDVPIDAGDRVEWAGQVYEVAGDPEHWPHPTMAGAVHHVEFTITQQTG